jgi:glutaredoxin 3
MNRVEIYSHQHCSYCHRAKALLEARGISYQEQDVGRDQQLLAEMVQRTGGRTFPQIVINDQPIGGYTELAELDRTQQLDSLIYP